MNRVRQGVCTPTLGPPTVRGWGYYLGHLYTPFSNNSEWVVFQRIQTYLMSCKKYVKVPFPWLCDTNPSSQPPKLNILPDSTALLVNPVSTRSADAGKSQQWWNKWVNGSWRNDKVRWIIIHQYLLRHAPGGKTSPWPCPCPSYGITRCCITHLDTTIELW